MAINIKTPGIHHIALRCKDMNRSKQFYKEILGFELVLDTPDLFGIMVGSNFIGFRPAKVADDGETVFNPFHIGMDHLAMACENEEELRRVAKALADAGVENTGVKKDSLLNKNYVAFKDPDRIQWELYMI
ncbi:VOC family protein [Pontibacter pamirensis]|uniref:VOC family protein n=1 Tax=Pontibacter pamirensis TaxID=2562824 RepID=UPI00138A1DF9|nr:VOC family protein [Pontibacter pamirensis]